MTRIASLALGAILGLSVALAQPAAATKDAGWTTLFDGKTLAGWRAFKSETPPPGWAVKDGVLANSGKGGDLMTVREFGSFELELDYKIAIGGNSGVMYRVVTEGNAPYGAVPSTRSSTTSVTPTPRTARTPALRSQLRPDCAVCRGEQARRGVEHREIVVQGNHVEHWLNGTKVVEYEFGSPSWTKLVAESKFEGVADLRQGREGAHRAPGPRQRRRVPQHPHQGPELMPTAVRLKLSIMMFLQYFTWGSVVRDDGSVSQPRP